MVGLVCDNQQVQVPFVCVDLLKNRGPLKSNDLLNKLPLKHGKILGIFGTKPVYFWALAGAPLPLSIPLPRRLQDVAMP